MTMDTLVVRIVESVVIVLGGTILLAFLNRGIEMIARSANLPRLALGPVRVMVRYLLLAAVICLVLTRFGFDVSGLLAMLTGVLAMVAIGFVAVWSLLSNFLSTFVLILFKPFSVGDDLEIPSDSVSGRVVDLTLLFTTLRTPDGATYQIPNNMFFQKIFLRRRGAQSIELSDQLQREKPAE